VIPAVARRRGLFSPTDHWGRFVALVVALYVARGVALLCVLPPFEAWDEFNHVAYVDRMSHTGATRPVPGETRVEADFIQKLVSVPQPTGPGLSQFGAQTLNEFWTKGSPPPCFDAGATPMPWLYQSQHPATYYELAAPIYRLAGGSQSLPESVSVLRLVNVLVSATGLIAVAWVARRATPDARLAGLIVALVALQPLLLLNAARVANDAPAVTLGWWAVALAVVSPRTILLRAARAVALALVVGLAISIKTTNLALLPFAVLVLAMDARVSRRGVVWLVETLATMLVLACGVLVFNYGEFRDNLERFHTLTPMVEALMNRSADRGIGDVFSVHALSNLPVLWSNWWVYGALWVGGWSFFTPPRSLAVSHLALFGVALAAGVAGLLKWRTRSVESGATEYRMSLAKCALLILSVTAALSYHSLHSLAARGQSYTNPWYTAVGVPALLVCAVAAVASGTSARAALVWGLSLGAVYVVAESMGVWFQMIPAYTGGLRPGGLALERLASLRPIWLGTPTLVASVCVAVVSLLIAFGTLVFGARRNPSLIR